MSHPCQLELQKTHMKKIPQFCMHEWDSVLSICNILSKVNPNRQQRDINPCIYSPSCTECTLSLSLDALIPEAGPNLDNHTSYGKCPKGIKL